MNIIKDTNTDLLKINFFLETFPIILYIKELFLSQFLILHDYTTHIVFIN